jgi:hypothetical protein
MTKLGMPQVFIPSMTAITVLFSISYFVNPLTEHIISVCIFPFAFLFVFALCARIIEKGYFSCSLTFRLPPFSCKPNNSHDSSNDNNAQKNNAAPSCQPLNDMQECNKGYAQADEDKNNNRYPYYELGKTLISTVFRYETAPYVNVCLRVYRLVKRVSTRTA